MNPPPVDLTVTMKTLKSEKKLKKDQKKNVRDISSKNVT
jgi:hypothetical protein